MRRPRISISRLMVVIVFIALSLAALSRPTRLWAAIVFAFVGIALVVATIRWASAPGIERGYWRGFSIAGWICFLIHFGPLQIFSSRGQHPVDTPSLAILDSLHDIGEAVGAIPPPPVAPVPSSPSPAWNILEPNRLNSRTYWLEYDYLPPFSHGAERHPPFVQAGYLMICFVCALVGGALGAHFERRVSRIVDTTTESGTPGV